MVAPTQQQVYSPEQYSPEQYSPEQYSPEEYLALEETATEKSEFWGGERIPMTGGRSATHNEIAGNVYTLLKLALRQQPYKVFIGDVRLWIPDCQLFTYPDVMAIAGEPGFYEGRSDTVMNPCLIVEVLSKSTRNYDQGDKFDGYRTMPEFQDYVLVDQYQMQVKHFAKTDDGNWLLKEYGDKSQRLTLASVMFGLSLAEIYEDITF
ncbi:MAG: Uma2 family endonuclease [Cyanothece sp. SIO2G6]|nr:Uma2 family endonuclease [Cyanothece sp. SIO2G6]